MSSGTVRLRRFVVAADSLTLDQLLDVSAASASSGAAIQYKDSSVDPAFSTGWHSAQLSTSDLPDVDATTVSQNDLLAFNVNATDPTFGDGWFPKNVGNVFSDLDATVNSIVGLNTAKIQAEAGNPAKTDMVLFTAVPPPVIGGGLIPGTQNDETCSIGSNGSNNVISKKEPSEGSFSFVQTLARGQNVDLVFPAGTVLRSTKGIYGFSGPLATPLGVQSFAITESQFHVSAVATLNVVSLGTEVTVSILSADRSTTVSGPTTALAYQTASLACPAAGEYFVASSGPINACVNEGDTRIRPLAPMTTDLITWNTGCLVSALENDTSVTYFRRNGTTGTVTVSPGTATPLGAGSDGLLSPNGCVRVTADKPISVFTDTDSVGNQSISGCPVSQMAQVFCNPALIDNSASYAEAGIAVASPFEGSAKVFDANGVIVGTFDYVRSTPAATPEDQAFPAAGRWKPSDVENDTELDGGWVQTTTPCIAIFNTNGDDIWNSTGQEYVVMGTTPDSVRADIKRDVNGFFRRRDIDSAGNITWTIC